VFRRGGFFGVGFFSKKCTPRHSFGLKNNSAGKSLRSRRYQLPIQDNPARKNRATASEFDKEFLALCRVPQARAARAHEVDKVCRGEKSFALGAQTGAAL
jgi:hypothetical protein